MWYVRSSNRTYHIKSNQFISETADSKQSITDTVITTHSLDVVSSTALCSTDTVIIIIIIIIIIINSRM